MPQVGPCLFFTLPEWIQPTAEDGGRIGTDRGDTLRTQGMDGDTQKGTRRREKSCCRSSHAGK